VISLCGVTCERQIASSKHAINVQTNLIKVGPGILPIVLEHRRQHYGRLIKVRERFFVYGQFVRVLPSYAYRCKELSGVGCAGRFYTSLRSAGGFVSIATDHNMRTVRVVRETV
jgi:hypothetical protein